ncbi:MAG: fasciclin domain-containing protein [Dongiaceae bacterium]
MLRKKSLFATVLTGAMLIATASFADVMVGGQPMFPEKNIIENAVNSADHTTLVAAVQAAGLVETLQGEGPFTVFAPVNSAFAALPAGTVETLLKPENKAMLTTVLTYHVVPGRYTFNDLKQMAKKMDGKAELKTASGGTLVVMLNGPTNLIVEDEKGGMANITISDVLQSNGVIHSIDKVLLPN